MEAFNACQMHVPNSFRSFGPILYSTAAALLMEYNKFTVSIQKVDVFTYVQS